MTQRQYPKENTVITIAWFSKPGETSLSVTDSKAWGKLQDLPLDKLESLRNILAGWFGNLDQIYTVKKEIAEMLGETKK